MNPRNKRQWWQKSIVRRTAALVEADLEAAASKCPFLDRTTEGAPIALFRRSEIKTGRLLGRGAFSEVFEVTEFDLDPELEGHACATYRKEFASQAVDPLTGQGRYVVKHLQESLLERKTDYSMAASDLALEAEYLKRLDHCNILSLKGLPIDGLQALEDGRHDGFFLILDRLESTLDEKIKHWGKVPCDDANSVLKAKRQCSIQIAKAIQFLHSNRIIFRDLKPQNVGFDINGNAKLFDFGLCRQLPESNGSMHETYSMTGVGTRRYMAPEVLAGATYNEAADVFSWSMVVWELFTHQKPFASLDVWDHADAVCYDGQRPPLETEIPPEVQFVLQKAWCQKIHARFTMLDIIHGLAMETKAVDTIAAPPLPTVLPVPARRARAA